MCQLFKIVVIVSPSIQEHLELLVLLQFFPEILPRTDAKKVSAKAEKVE